MSVKTFMHLSAALFLLSLCFQQPVMAEMATPDMKPDTLSQSFNGETRGVDVTVLGDSDLTVTSMTLDGFNISDPADTTIEARIYQDKGAAPAASATAVVHSGAGQSLTIPLPAALAAGKNYRLAFFIPEDIKGGGNTADGFLPEFPYVEASGVFRVNQAYSTGANEFPEDINQQLPMMKITVKDKSGKESVISLGSGRKVKQQ